MTRLPKPRGVLIAGNWKMNHGLKETENFFSELEKQTRSVFSADFETKRNSLRVCLFPPFTSLIKAQSEAPRLSSPPVLIGAQNAHWEKSGAFTGETSGPLLRELGIQWVLIGHSERRQFFGESNSTVRKRTESLLLQGFHVVLCIGETLEERKTGKTKEILAQQIREGIPDLTSILKISRESNLGPELIVAYEPVWAIGTGLTASPSEVEEAHQTIRHLLSEQIGSDLSKQTSILYGGSVTPLNIDSLLACPNVDGALVGGASLKTESFTALLVAGARTV